MDYLIAENNYIVVEPSGDIKGFKELSDAKSFVGCYYLNNILDNTQRVKGYGTWFDLYQEEDQEDLNRILGVNEGECMIFDLDSILEVIRNRDIMNFTKDELEMLLKCKKNFSTSYKNSLYNFFPCASCQLSTLIANFSLVKND